MTTLLIVATVVFAAGVLRAERRRYLRNRRVRPTPPATLPHGACPDCGAQTIIGSHVCDHGVHVAAGGAKVTIAGKDITDSVQGLTIHWSTPRVRQRIREQPPIPNGDGAA